MRYLIFSFILTIQYPIHCFANEGKQPIDVLTGVYELELSAEDKSVKGTVEYSIQFIAPVDSFYLDARQMNIEKIFFNNKPVSFNYKKNKIWIYASIDSLKVETLSIEYNATPKKSMYFLSSYKEGEHQIWTQGQGKNNSHWLPGFDDYNEKIIYSCKITFDARYEVISNGKLLKTETHNHLKTWHYAMEKPMSSYLLALVVGKYQKKVLFSKSGVPIELYYYENDSLTVKKMYKHVKPVFDFLEQNIGYNYSWGVYRQIPVKDFLHGGMENTTLTIFPDEMFKNDYGQSIIENINLWAHELAHHWFGNLITQKSDHDHWLHEGFATYYALKSCKTLVNKDYFYSELYKTSQKLKYGRSRILTATGNDSFTYYNKGALVLYLIEEKIGTKKFKETIRIFLNKFAYHNSSTKDFLEILENNNPAVDLTDFIHTWFYSKEIEENAFEPIQKSRFFKRNTKLKKQIQSNQELNNYPSYITQVATEASIKYLEKKPFYKLMYRFLKSEDIATKLIPLEILDSIPIRFQSQLKTLITDPNPTIQLLAFRSLIDSEPKSVNVFLGQSPFRTSSYNKKTDNRIFWLFLAIVNNYDIEKTNIYVKELISYTNPIYDAKTRYTALSSLASMNLYSKKVIKSLIQCSIYHLSYLKKFARKTLSDYIDKSGTKFDFQLYDLTKDEETYLKENF